jgi:replicative DNA helicase
MTDKNKTAPEAYGLSKPIRLLVEKTISQIEHTMAGSDGSSGIATGFADLDKLTGGWQRGDMVVVASRPAVGKTSFLLSMVNTIAVNQKRAVAIFSMEVSGMQITSRLISMGSGIGSDKLRSGELSDAEVSILREHAERVADAPIFIDDRADLKTSELCAEARRLKSEHNVELIIIDHLQVIASDMKRRDASREQEVSGTSRSIKRLARELNIPIVVISQLNRSVETRGGDKRPMLSDLRESGAIEQDADVVCFLYRAEYYGIHEDENGPALGVGEVIVAKHRNGPVGAVRMRFIPELAKFADWQSIPQWHGLPRNE